MFEKIEIQYNFNGQKIWKCILNFLSDVHFKTSCYYTFQSIQPANFSKKLTKA